MTGPIPLPRQYPAHLQLCYRGVKLQTSSAAAVRRPWWLGRKLYP